MQFVCVVKLFFFSPPPILPVVTGYVGKDKPEGVGHFTNVVKIIP